MTGLKGHFQKLRIEGITAVFTQRAHPESLKGSDCHPGQPASTVSLGMGVEEQLCIMLTGAATKHVRDTCWQKTLTAQW